MTSNNDVVMPGKNLLDFKNYMDSISSNHVTFHLGYGSSRMQPFPDQFNPIVQFRGGALWNDTAPANIFTEKYLEYYNLLLWSWYAYDALASDIGESSPVSTKKRNVVALVGHNDYRDHPYWIPVLVKARIFERGGADVPKENLSINVGRHRQRQHWELDYGNLYSKDQRYRTLYDGDRLVLLSNWYHDFTSSWWMLDELSRCSYLTDIYSTRVFRGDSNVVFSSWVGTEWLSRDGASVAEIQLWLHARNIARRMLEYRYASWRSKVSCRLAKAEL